MKVRTLPWRYTMSLNALLLLAGKSRRIMPHKKLVKDWWPKPSIRTIPEKYWGDKWSNNRGILHKYECFSFSRIGFHTNRVQKPGLPLNKCLAYGETPEQAYDQWCVIFNVWNDKEDWVK